MSKRWIPIWLILAAAFICHGLILTESVRLHDDWSYAEWMSRREWSTIFEVHRYSNNLIMLWYFWILSFFQDFLTAGRIGSFISVAGSGVLTYLVCLETRYVEEKDATFIALISMVYPGYMMHTSFSLALSTFCFLLFLAGALVALQSERHAGARYVGTRLAALILFFMSFCLNSLLVYYGAFLLVHFLVMRRKWDLPPAAAAARYTTRRIDFILIPLLFWGIRLAMKTAYITNPDYNAISFSLENLDGYRFFAQAIQLQWLMIVKSHWFLAALPIGWWFARRQFAGNDPVGSAGASNYWLLLAFGIVLLVCGTLPYVVVGKNPGGDVEQWGTRTCLLIGLPVAILVVALGRLLQIYARLPPAVVGGIFAAVIAGSSAVHVQHYIRFLANEIEARSLIVNLAAYRGKTDASVFGIVTRLPSINYVHQKYSLAYLLRASLGGGLTRMAFMEGDVDAAISTRKTYTSEQIREETADWWFRLYGINVPPDGKQATLLIEPGPARLRDSNLVMVSRYILKKWFTPGRLDEFLREVTKVTITPKAPSS